MPAIQAKTSSFLIASSFFEIQFPARGVGLPLADRKLLAVIDDPSQSTIMISNVTSSWKTPFDNSASTESCYISAESVG
jgi:hypothetical protein